MIREQPWYDQENEGLDFANELEAFGNAAARNGNQRWKEKEDDNGHKRKKRNDNAMEIILPPPEKNR